MHEGRKFFSEKGFLSILSKSEFLVLVPSKILDESVVLALLASAALRAKMGEMFGMRNNEQTFKKNEGNILFDEILLNRANNFVKGCKS